MSSFPEEKNEKSKLSDSAEKFPWGFTEEISCGNNFSVKKVHLFSNKGLLLQNDDYCGILLKIVSGRVTLVIDNKEYGLKQGDKIWISTKNKKLENNESEEAVLLMVNTFNCLNEEDMVKVASIIKDNHMEQPML